MRDSATENVAAIAAKVTVAGGGTALLGGLTANEIAAFGGLIVGVIGLIVQIYYKRKEDRRRVVQHEKFIEKMHLPPESEE